jgi:hypothetical protein
MPLDVGWQATPDATGNETDPWRSAIFNFHVEIEIIPGLSAALSFPVG